MMKDTDKENDEYRLESKMYGDICNCIILQDEDNIQDKLLKVDLMRHTSRYQTFHYSLYCSRF